MRPIRLAVAAALCALALLPGACVLHDALFGFPGPTITTRSAASIELPYREGPGGLILIKGATTHKTGANAETTADVEYILDTGAPVTVVLDGPATKALQLDTSNARKLGAADNPAAPTGVIEKGFGIDFGDLALSDLTAVVIAEKSLPCNERFARVGFQGVIGADLFRNFIVEVDAKAKTIRLHRPAAFLPGDLRAVPLVFSSDGHPHIDTEIVVTPGVTETVRLHVDSGSSTPASFLPGARPGLVALPDGKKGKACFVQGELDTVVGPPVTVLLGGLAVQVEAPLLVAKERVDGKGVAGTIGAGLLGRYRYAIDYPGKRLWVGARPG